MPLVTKLVLINSETKDVYGSVVVYEGPKKDMCQTAMEGLKAVAPGELVFKKPRTDITMDPSTITSYLDFKSKLKVAGTTPVAVKEYDEVRCTGHKLWAACAKAVKRDTVPNEWPDFCIIKGGDSVYGNLTPSLYSALVAYGKGGTDAADALKKLAKPQLFYDVTYGDLVQTQARARKKLLVAVLDGREDRECDRSKVGVTVNKAGACVVRTGPYGGTPVAAEEVARLKQRAQEDRDTIWGAVFKAGPDLYCAATDELYAALRNPAAAPDNTYCVPIVSGFLGTANDRYVFERDIFNASVAQYRDEQPPDHFQIVFAPIPDFTVMGVTQHGRIIDELKRMKMGPGDMVCVHCAEGMGRSAQALYTLFAQYAPKDLQTADCADTFIHDAYDYGEAEITDIIALNLKMPKGWIFDTARRAAANKRPERPEFFATFVDAGTPNTKVAIGNGHGS